MIKSAYIFAGVFVLQACASIHESKPTTDPIAVYKEGMEEGSKAMIEEIRENLKQKKAYGSVEPYNPVRLPSDIRKVWIVEHPNEAGDLIQGHWVFMVVRPGRWSSPSVPALHPQSESKTPSPIPMIEDKPSPGTPNSRNASQGQ